jgi:hypothetical protein
MYDYKKIRPILFTEEMQGTFLGIRARTHKLINESGAAKMDKIIKEFGGIVWNLMACVDRLVELEEISEAFYMDCKGQDRIFIK